MVRLFEDACRQLLSVPPPMRRAWLDSQRPANPRAVEMLVPIVEHLGEKDVQQALAWCRRYAVTLTSAAPPSPGREEPATD